MVAVALAWRFAGLSRVVLFWAAFILTRPLGATLGDFLNKPTSTGGLNLGRFSSSAVLLAVVDRADRSQQPAARARGRSTGPRPEFAPGPVRSTTRESNGGLGRPGEGDTANPCCRLAPLLSGDVRDAPLPFRATPPATPRRAAQLGRILELFTGSDRYGAVAFQQAGFLTGEADVPASQMQSPDGRPAVDVPSRESVCPSQPSRPPPRWRPCLACSAAITSAWTTKRGSSWAGNAMYSWPKYQAYFDRTARVR